MKALVSQWKDKPQSGKNICKQRIYKEFKTQQKKQITHGQDTNRHFIKDDISMAISTWKDVNYLSTRAIQNKTTMLYYQIPIKIAKIKK